MGHSGKGLLSVFQGFPASIGKAFALAGDWALGYHLGPLDTFLIFPNFLSLKSFGSS